MIVQEQLLVVRAYLLVDHLERQKRVGWQLGQLLDRRLFERLQSPIDCFERIRVRG
jgi:hypothetical protein